MRLLMSFNNSLAGIVGLAVGIVAIATVVFLIIVFVVVKKRDDEHAKEIGNLSNTLRVFVVDIKNDQVKYFNSANLRERKTSSITTFYNQYRTKEREQLINWIGDLLDNNENTPKYLEIKVFIKSARENVSSILEVQKIDYEKELIYLESYILQSGHGLKKKGEKANFSKIDYFSKKILVSNGKGTSFAFNFFNTVTKISDISQVAYADIKDILVSFASDDIIVTEEKYGVILIANLNVKGKIESYSFLNEVKSKLNRFLLIKSYSKDIAFTIGVIDNGENFRDVNTLIKNVVVVSDIAKDEPEQVSFFSDIKTIITEEQGKQYRSDVQTIIEDNKLKYFFQPIYSVKRNRIIGYHSSVAPFDSYFKDIDTLKNYAMRTEDDKELFSTIAKNVISRFMQEKNETNVMLFFTISFYEINHVAKILSHTSGVNDTNIVLVLKERDLSALPDEFEEDTLIDSIRSFKSKGYAVALEIEDDILTLSPTLYSVFDYFNLSVATHISKKNAGRNLPTFQGLIENLLHYEKPLVAFNIQSWDILELVYRLGIQNICSDAISEPSENIMPIQKKIISKIQNLKS